jgi:hypothetical protein
MECKAKAVVGPRLRKFRPEKVRKESPFMGPLGLHGEKGEQCQGFLEESDGFSVSKDAWRAEEPQLKHRKPLFLVLMILSLRNLPSWIRGFCVMAGYNFMLIIHKMVDGNQ